MRRRPRPAVQVVRGSRGARSTIRRWRSCSRPRSPSEGQATDRLAEVFDTIAPDEERKQRVLTMTRTMLCGNRLRPVEAVQGHLVVDGRAADRVQRRAVRLAAVSIAARRRRRRAARRWPLKDLPEELPAWIESLGQENVRKLSVMLHHRSPEARARTGACGGNCATT